MKLRLLQVLPGFFDGGAERMVVNLTEALDRTAFEVAVVGFSPGSASVQTALDTVGATTHTFGKRIGFDPRTFVWFGQLYTQLRPHIIHTHLHVLRYVLPTAWRLHRGPLVHTIHTAPHREVDRPTSLLQRRSFRGRVTPVAVSNAVANEARRQYGLKTVRVIPTGIPLARFKSDVAESEHRRRWRQANGFSPQDFLFVCVARLDPVKNHEMLIDAFRLVCSVVPNVRLLIAGDGPSRSHLENLALSSSHGDRIHFLGPRDDVPTVLASSDVFVSSSNWEGGPLAVVEAMAVGLPVVATRVGWVPDVVEASGAGFVVPAAATAVFAEHMISLAQDEDLRQTCSRAAKSSVDEFDASHMARSYEDLYMSLSLSSSKRESTSRTAG